MAADSERSLRALIIGPSADPEPWLGRPLSTQGVAVDCRVGIESGFPALLRDAHDVVVVILGPSAHEGVELCRALRARSGLPLLALSEGGDESGRVLALEAGADSALVWPLSTRELAAQLRALTRRRPWMGSSEEPVRLGELEISSRDHAARLNGRSLGLTTTEFAILRVLAEHAGGTLSRERILELVKGGTDEAFDRSIDVHISRLRHKLGDDPRDPRFVRTVRGKGYLLAAVR
ncbi:MAG TPA: response regulator transcription factor [Anaeromyxobacteraceae bacterium]|nr:response regulator transcription factor [Anaeromyxobacteraceae bacterium]